MLFKALHLTCFFYTATSIASFTIMIDPAGSSKEVGRVLHKGFERGATLQFAAKLKEQILNKYANVHTIISKNSRDQEEELQSANFANRLKVDLYLSINFYNENKVKSCIHIYYYRPQLLTSTPGKSQLSFIAHDKAHITNQSKSKRWAIYMQNYLQKKSHQHYFECKKTIGIPFKPLIGIVAPAIAIEIGIQKHGYKNFIKPIVDSLGSMIRE